MCIRDRNYPNPFNPSTNIKYVITSNAFVTLKVYDVLGNEVTTLVNEEKSAGNYDVRFDISKLSANTQGLSSGIYFYRLQTCLLYTSDAADERSSVDLGGRRIIKKNNTQQHNIHNIRNHTHVIIQT